MFQHDVIQKTEVHDIIVREEPSRDHMTYTENFNEIWTCGFRDTRAGRLTDRQTYKQTDMLIAILGTLPGEVKSSLCITLHCMLGSTERQLS